MIGFNLGVTRLAGSSGNWFETSTFDDYSIVADFTNNRYAMPALYANGTPILSRVNGKFPKRAVSASDILDITRAILPDQQFTEATWPLADGVVRTENLLGTMGMVVEPNRRFNRIHNSDTLPALPRSVSLSRGTMTYTISWIGNDDLVLTVAGHAGSNQTLTAQSADPNGFNWGYVPVISGWNGNLTVIAAAGNPGRVAHSVNADTQSSDTIYRPPTTMIPTTAYTVGGEVHTERGPEHVRFTSGVMDILKLVGGSNHRIRTGTLIVDQQQLKEPDVGSRRIVMGGGNPADGAEWGPSYFAFHESAGVYTAQFQTGDHNGDLSFTTTAAAMRNRMKMGLAIQYSAATPWTNMKRAAITGQVASTTADNNRGMEGNQSYWMCSSATSDPLDGPIMKGGMGIFYSIKWSPEFMSEAALSAAVA